jgi:L-aminopeptidase/D-esterase-like protein
MLTDVPGIRVGHWTDGSARTGCTVALLPEGTVGSAEVRGGAPASRELALLAPERTVQRVDAVLLTGGSAFGLAAADGVMRHCREHGLGVVTPAGAVPIVPALALFDLAVGEPRTPGPAEGYAACEAASTEPVTLGRLGAGTGATIGKWRGVSAARPGGLAGATLRVGGLIVSALVAVNAMGDVDRDGSATWRAMEDLVAGRVAPGGGPLVESTTVGIVATNARLDKLGCLLLAQGAHDGLSRSVVPAHTRLDGDAMVAVATGGVEAGLDTVRMVAAAVVERAVRAL